MYRKLSFMLYTLGCFTAVGTCVIVNLAVKGGLTWSIYPILSIPLGWAVGAPLWLKNTRRGILLALAVLSVLLLPFLYLLALHTGGGWFLPLGLPCAAIGIAAMWAIYALFRFARIGFFYKLSISILLAGAVVGPAVNTIAGHYVGQVPSILNTFINVFASVLAAAVLAIIGYVRANQRRGPR